MDFSLTEEQQMLRNTARDFIRREIPRWQVIKEIDESASGFSEELWRKMAEMGWLGIIIPEAYGGMGGSLTDLAVVYEELGKSAFLMPFFSSAVLSASIILEAGSEQQKKQLLPAIAGGKKILTLAFTEADYGWKPECIRLSATRKNGKFVLNGTKRFIHDAQVANQVICVARTKESNDPTEGITLFLVDMDSAGLSRKALNGYIGEKLNELTFNSVEVPESNILGQLDKGWATLNNPLNRSMVALCSYMVGGCQYVLDLTVEYSRTRVQFGQPIAAFQWVQGYIIEQANQLEKARWVTYEALWKLDTNKPQQEQDEAASMAKAVTSDAFHECGHLGHEVHAGVGVDKKYSLYLYSKKSKTLYSYLGDPYFHRQRMAKLVLDA